MIPSAWSCTSIRCLDLTSHTNSLQFAPPAEARLTAGDPIKNASAILRYALPIDDKKPIRQLQVSTKGCSFRDMTALGLQL